MGGASSSPAAAPPGPRAAVPPGSAQSRQPPESAVPSGVAPPRPETAPPAPPPRLEAHVVGPPPLQPEEPDAVQCPRAPEGWEVECVWPNLQKFFELPEVADLSKDKRRKLSRILNHGSPEEFEELCMQLFQEHGGEGYLGQLEAHVSSVNQDEDMNFHTVVSQLFDLRKRPKPPELKALLRTKDPPYFSGRVLDITGTDSITVGIVETCERRDGKFVFHLRTEFSRHLQPVQIAADFSRVTVQRMHPCQGFFKAVHRSHLDEGCYFFFDQCPVQFSEGLHQVVKLERGVPGASVKGVTVKSDQGVVWHIQVRTAGWWGQQPRVSIMGSNDDCKWSASSEADFDRHVRVRPRYDEAVGGINRSTFDALVKVRDQTENDQATQKEALRRKVEEAKHHLRMHLRAEPNKWMFTRILEEMLANRTRLLDVLPTMGDDLLRDLVHNIVTLQRELEEDVPEEGTVLSDAMHDALYENVVNEDNRSKEAPKSPVIVANVMEVLELSEKEVAKMEGAKLVLLLGDTGCGKSTTACDLLGIPLKRVKNALGDTVFAHDRHDCPRIGQSWCRSETRYATAYEIPGQSPQAKVMLVDCPGFEDTRGADFELCTNLSLDRAVTAASGISAVVVLIPFLALRERRGQAMVEALARVKSRFPDLVTPAACAALPILHVLVTKASRCDREQAEVIEWGTFAKDALQNCEKEIQRVRQMGDQFLLNGLEEQHALWHCLVLLGAEGRIRLIKVGDKVARRERWEQYTACAASAVRPAYVPSLEDGCLQKKLADFVSQHAHVWRVQIYKQYREVVPQRMSKVEADIGDAVQKLQEARQCREEEGRRLRDSISEARRRISNVQQSRLQGSTQQLADADMLQQLHRLCAVAEEAHRARYKEERALLAQGLEACEEAVRVKRRCRDQCQDALRKVEDSIRHFLAEQETLSTGSIDIVLAQYDAPAEDTMQLWYYADGEQAAALAEVRDLSEDKVERKETVPVETYAGPMQRHVCISKEYRLVPTDAGIRAQFRNDCRDWVELGTTVARVEGQKYKLSGRNAKPDGKTVAYCIDLLWDGRRPYPSFNVHHNIPNVDYNEAELNNLSADLTMKHRDKALHEKELERAERDLEQALAAWTGAADRYRSWQEGVNDDRMDRMRDSWDQLLQIEQASLEELEWEERSYNDGLQASEEREAQMEDGVASLRAKLRHLMQEKRRLALVIHRRHASVAFLRKFASFLESIAGRKAEGKTGKATVAHDMLVRGSTMLNAKQVSNNVFEEYRLFQEAYDAAEQANILQMVDQDLALAAAERR